MHLWQPDIKPPPSLWQWMQTNTSITERARAVCQTVHLDLLQEGWNNGTFVREINMLCDGKLAWYARTWIPETTYRLRAKQFEQLQGHYLGSILFHDAGITRDKVTYIYLIPSMLEYQWAIKHMPSDNPLPEYLWARRSVFLIDSEPLYLLEVFFREQWDAY